MNVRRETAGKPFKITLAVPEDLTAVLSLYRRVAAIEGGLARTEAEITEEYVKGILARSLATGLSLVAGGEDGAGLLGEIHAYSLGPKTFAHVLGELTIAVHPDYHGMGIGKALFRTFLDDLEANRPDILRVELIARESNANAIAFYRKLGFEIEGRLEGRIRSLGGGYEADIPMAWIRKDA